MMNPERGQPVDRALLDRYRTMAGAGFVKVLINQYLDESASLVEAILAAISENRAAAIAAPAHKLKGSSATLGAVEMSAICAEIEARTRAGEPDEAALLGVELTARYQAVRLELQRLLPAEADQLD
jgi:HPt (histidine-containing phosphotransfer) domain-containing protein